jgi:DNA repair protein RadC
MALFGYLPQLQRLADPGAAGALFAPMAEEEVEVAAFVYLDGDQRVLGLRELRSDRHDTFELPIRAIVGDALRHDARGVVMAHNHPSGDSTPSTADREATRMLARALEPIGVRLLDHLVVTRSGITSFRTMGLL